MGGVDFRIFLSTYFVPGTFFFFFQFDFVSSETLVRRDSRLTFYRFREELKEGN